MYCRQSVVLIYFLLLLCFPTEVNFIIMSEVSKIVHIFTGLHGRLSNIIKKQEFILYYSSNSTILLFFKFYYSTILQFLLFY